ncbi:zinc-alpha-2-glycoprotein-like isoform X2 [Onychostoma macrolepis]|uniref:zinc-alpha-2-glycoprotein-like isoform X2 n=1 Tax=Onychostoma macrolepis TaxID=369639 RepID=UPI00272976D5|nr:zinc-alpha-2-glycoprotein-like isoform X2 [Onychostoma macrolepis]
MQYLFGKNEVIYSMNAFCVCLLTCFTVTKAGSHSLMAFATYIVGQTPFPEFSVVLMLDDVQIGYYDSTTWSVINRIPRDSKYQNEEKSDADFVFLDMYNNMKERAIYFKEHLNQTNGVHVQQRLAGCELLNDDKPGLLQRWDSFNGQEIGEYTFDTEKNVQTKIIWGPWSQLTRFQMKFLIENIYQPICIKVLLKPRVRLMKKTLSDSHGLQISCLATGFYPRHINLTLFRDGQPVDDDQITGGEILPNGDGTYQMKKSLVISEEELHEGHKYNCSMKHLNLDNKLDITFDVAEYEPGSTTQSVVIIVLVFVCGAVLVITALIIWRKIHTAGQGFKKSQSDDSFTPCCDSLEPAGSNKLLRHLSRASIELN